MQPHALGTLKKKISEEEGKEERGQYRRPNVAPVGEVETTQELKHYNLFTHLLSSTINFFSKVKTPTITTPNLVGYRVVMLWRMGGIYSIQLYLNK